MLCGHCLLNPIICTCRVVQVVAWSSGVLQNQNWVTPQRSTNVLLPVQAVLVHLLRQNGIVKVASCIQQRLHNWSRKNSCESIILKPSGSPTKPIIISGLPVHLQITKEIESRKAGWGILGRWLHLRPIAEALQFGSRRCNSMWRVRLGII